jgi:hypothetical protein
MLQNLEECKKLNINGSEKIFMGIFRFHFPVQPLFYENEFPSIRKCMS